MGQSAGSIVCASFRINSVCVKIFVWLVQYYFCLIEVIVIAYIFFDKLLIPLALCKENILQKRFASGSDEGRSHIFVSLLYIV